MIRSPDEDITRQHHAHVARELAISPDILDLHIYRVIDAGLGFDPPRWRILWDYHAPEDVRTMGEGDHLWSEIAAIPGADAGPHVDE